MPTGVEECLRDDGFVAELFAKEYRKMVRYATVVFQKRGGYVDPVGRAEDIVQETFFLAYEKQAALMQSDDPAKWLKSAMHYKLCEALKEDRKWVKGLMLLPSEEEAIPFAEPEDLSDLVSKEDYTLLRQIYIEGYTYQELCTQLGISKSNLGMRINRIKKEFRKQYKKFFDSV